MPSHVTISLLLDCVLIASGVLQETQDIDTFRTTFAMESSCPKASSASLLQIEKSHKRHSRQAHTSELPPTGGGLIAKVKQETLPAKQDPDNGGLEGALDDALDQALDKALDRALATGLSATLDEKGFKEVQMLRCPHPCMFDYVRRVIEQEGYVVCHESGLAGFVVWFDAPEDHTSYQNLVGEVHKAAQEENLCFKWLGGCDSDCTDLPADCPGWPFATLAPCGNATVGDNNVTAAVISNKTIAAESMSTTGAPGRSAAGEAGTLETRKEFGKKFLEENKKKEGVITLPSGLQYKVLRAGDGADHPTASSPCDCHYEGRTAQEWPSGKKFDSSYDRGSPTSFAPNQVIKGWTEAMQLMVEGDKWEMYIPSELGYGDSGSPPNIGGGDVLVFTMEIIKIKGDKKPASSAAPTTTSTNRRLPNIEGRADDYVD